MSQRTQAIIRAIAFICLSTLVGSVYAQQADEPNKPYKGEVRLRYDWLGITKDRGRFREDNWMTDRSTGGIDRLHLESTGPDKNGYEYLLEGRALYDYDYDLSFLMKKRDSHYFKFDFSGLRRYFDGSNEYWNSSLGRLAELHDSDFFVDRRNYNIELGLIPPEGAQWIFGWHRLEKDGKEVLLRGSRGNVAGGGTYYGVPDVLNTRGITDTFYGEVSRTFAEKYNFRAKQELEQYHAEQQGFMGARFNSTGDFSASSDNRWAKDNLGYTNWRTMVMFDSFLDEQTYVTANYLYSYLNNNSTHNYYRGTSYLNESDVGNSKRTNVTGLGYRRADALKVTGLDLSAGVRVEDSKTDAGSSGIANGSAFLAHSSLDDVRVAEVLRLIYKGIKRTTLSFDAQLEQRDLNWDATDTLNPDNFDRKTDIDYLDQIYALKAVHRFNAAVKSTIAYKYKNLERSQTNLFDLDPDEYPGWLGSNRRAGSDILAKTDFRLNNRTSTTLSYQFVQESIDFELGGKTSNREIHRGAGSLSFSPQENMFLVGTFMLENSNLDTPAFGTSGTVGSGSRPYDFRGNSYSLMLDGTYAFNEKTSSTVGLRHTEAMGTVDDAGDYVFDKVIIALKHRFAPNRTVGVGYEFYNFNNHAGRGGFDDYIGHGAFVTYEYTF